MVGASASLMLSTVSLQLNKSMREPGDAIFEEWKQEPEPEQRVRIVTQTNQ